MSSIDPIKEAIQVFMNIKEKVIDKFEDKEKSEEIGSKLRARAREIPEMMLELGLVPTLSYCLAKANIDNIKKVITIIERDTSIEELKDAKSEELAYALYTYALLKYLAIIMGNVKGIELKMEELAEKSEKEVSDILLKYFEALTEDTTKTPLHELLQSYLLQFKRLCETVYKPEGR